MSSILISAGTTGCKNDSEGYTLKIESASPDGNHRSLITGGFDELVCDLLYFLNTKYCRRRNYELELQCETTPHQQSVLERIVHLQNKLADISNIVGDE